MDPPAKRRRTATSKFLDLSSSLSMECESSNVIQMSLKFKTLWVCYVITGYVNDSS